MTNRREHCNICEHNTLSSEGGFMCGVTQERPDFEGTCDKVKFGETLKGHIEHYHAQYEISKRGRIWIYIQSFMIFSAGIGASIYGEYLWSIIYGTTLLVRGRPDLTLGISAAPIIVLLIGLTVVLVSLRLLIKSLKDQSEALNSKKKLDQLLSLYGVTYEIDLYVSKERHGHRYINSEIKLYGGSQ